MPEYREPPMAPSAADAYAPPPKKRMSTTAKVLIGLAIAFGVLMVLGGIGIVVCAVACNAYMEDSVETDPEAVAAAAAAVADMNVPEGLEPVMCMDMRIPFSEERAMLMLAWADTSVERSSSDWTSMIVIGSAGNAFGAEANDGMRQGMENSLRQNGLGDDQGFISYTAREELTREVNGRPASYTLQRGQDTRDGRAVIRVDGAFEGRTGPAALTMVVDATRFPEPTVMAFLDSIH